MAARVRLEMGRLKHIQQAAPANADRIVEESARAIEGGAKINAPVDTGNLRNSISVQKAGEAKRRIGASAEYAIFQEMGTRHHAAHPFLKPAFDDEVPHLKQRLKGIVK